MVVDDAKAADLVGRGEGMKNGRSAKSLKAGGPRGQELAPLCDDHQWYFGVQQPGRWCTATGVRKWTSLKIII
jgi:hypothetical protein